MQQLQSAITTRLERGDTLETIERQLIAPSGIDPRRTAVGARSTPGHPKRPAASAPRLSVWAALGNALATLVGSYRY
jgi:hypothetical protein